MEGSYYPVKMKRKELEDVNDEFSDFSLSSPARKIRRLDAELPPIMEEEERDIPMLFSESLPLKENSYVGGGGSVVIEELESVPVNEERAIVLFKPAVDTPLLQSPSPYSFSVNSDFISGFKNRVMWSSQPNLLKAEDGETEKRDEDLVPGNGCLAVVPWVPTHSQPTPTPQVEAPQVDVSEMMEADEAEVATMDVEDNCIAVDQTPGSELGGMSVAEGLHQWKQHCMIPQPPQNLSTPVTWFR